MTRKSGRVVIVGGGFAGLSAAKSIRDRWDVTVIDRTREFEWTPNIHEVVSRRKSRADVRLDRSKLLGRLGHEHLEDEVVHVDTHGQRVATKAGAQVAYDALILAPGCAATFAVRGAREHALPFRNGDDAHLISGLLESFSDARHTATVTVAGGGHTGVEVLGELMRRYRKKPWIKLRMIETRARVMGDQPKKVHERIEKLAAKHDVELLTGASIAEVRANDIVLASGAVLPSDVTIWATGITAPAFLRESGLAPAGAFVPVQDTLQSIVHPSIFVAGDASDHRKRIPKLAERALAMGKRAGKNAVRWLEGKELGLFTESKAPRLINFGDLTAFAIRGDEVMEGAPLSLLREVIFQEGMSELEGMHVGRLQRRLRTTLARALSTGLDPTSIKLHA